MSTARGRNIISLDRQSARGRNNISFDRQSASARYNFYLQINIKS